MAWLPIQKILASWGKQTCKFSCILKKISTCYFSWAEKQNFNQNEGPCIMIKAKYLLSNNHKEQWFPKTTPGKQVLPEKIEFKGKNCSLRRNDKKGTL